MDSEKGWRVFLGSFILLIVCYVIYFVRYPMWQSFVSVEIINAISILSYFIVLLVAFLLLKKGSKKSLSVIFKNEGTVTILAGVGFEPLFE